MSRRGCDGIVPNWGACRTWPAWKVRAKGDTMERNWLYACGRHLNQVAQEYGSEPGDELDLVRVRPDD